MADFTYQAPAGQFKFSDEDLIRIVTGTQQSVEKMAALNGHVVAIAAQLPFVNNSAAGQRLSTGLQDWNQNFSNVVNKLSELNQKATALLQENRKTSENAKSLT